MRFYDRDKPVSIDDMSFDELHQRLHFYILKKARTHKIRGMETDDIYQELVFHFWRKLDRIPSHMRNFDFRFIKFVNSMLTRKLIDLNRRITFIDDEEVRRFRDAANHVNHDIDILDL